MQSTLIIIGISFGSAPEAARKRFRIAEARYVELLAKLVRCQAIDEVVMISTSDRTEFIVWTSDPAVAADSVLRYLSREFNLTRAEWAHFHRHTDEAALLHLLRTASGSQDAGSADMSHRRPGEAGLIAGIELAYREALRAGSLGRYLQTVLAKALAMTQLVSGTPPAGTPRPEAMLYAEVAELRAQLDAIRSNPVASELRSRLERLSREELQRLGEELGPFTREQQGALETLAANLMGRIATPLQRRLACAGGALEEESLAKIVRELFEPLGTVAPESTRRGGHG